MLFRSASSSPSEKLRVAVVGVRGRGMSHVQGFLSKSTNAEITTICDCDADVIANAMNTITKGQGKDWGLSLATPVIVKYRDSKTDTRTELEQWIR